MIYLMELNEINLKTRLPDAGTRLRFVGSINHALLKLLREFILYKNKSNQKECLNVTPTTSWTRVPV